MDPEERSVLGVFPTLEEAVAACKRLQEWAKRGITAKELYELWGMLEKTHLSKAVASRTRAQSSIGKAEIAGQRCTDVRGDYSCTVVLTNCSWAD
jgi:hypothetical protein